ncbi:hypothetical protein [Altericista sp. CCNU0014]|uniref:hypothetical protein n=1 Tax=Altericista sp. CCNU0014 TaxID=3082949 RepID=UPI003850B944
MEKLQIKTQVSKKDLQFQPGGPAVSFDVKVINTSDRFAAFGVKVLAAGVEASAGDRWYHLSPDVSTKTPPGDFASFSIWILDTPKPGFVGVMNLFVQIYSLELRHEEREILRLKLVPAKDAIPLKLELGSRSFNARSSESIEIPVVATNLGQSPVETVLRCNGLAPGWLPEGTERRLKIRPGDRAQTHFLCQIPPPPQSPSEIYPFVIEAIQEGGKVSTANGVVLVMPTGWIDFSCTSNERQIPENRRWWPHWTANTARYPLLFANQGNLNQLATARIFEDAEGPKCNAHLEPSEIEIEMGTTAQLDLVVGKRRHWFGLTQKCRVEVKASVLSDPALPIQNETQSVKLRIHPLFPLWMQGLGGLACLWLLWWLSWLNPNSPFWGHRDVVNSVRLNGIGENLISGSSDKSILAWYADGFFNPFLNQNMGKIGKTGDRSVRVVRYRPVNNDRVAAGLENGEIQLWNALPGNAKPLQTFFFQKDDRVLDLAYTQDSRSLFSGHGSGTVVQWNLEPQESSQGLNAPPTVARKVAVGFPVYAIALVGLQEEALAIAGGRDRIALLDLKTNKLRDISTAWGSQADYVLGIATADRKRTLLATANNRGLIQMWNLQPCLSAAANCELLDRWTAEPKAVHSVALSADGCYLASGSEGGATMLWPLNPRGDRSGQSARGLKLNRSSKSINAVDIVRIRNEILVARGGDDHQVSLYRTPALSQTCP